MWACSHTVHLTILELGGHAVKLIDHLKSDKKVFIYSAHRLLELAARGG